MWSLPCSQRLALALATCRTCRWAAGEGGIRLPHMGRKQAAPAVANLEASPLQFMASFSLNKAHAIGCAADKAHSAYHNARKYVTNTAESRVCVMQANGHLPAELESVPTGGNDQEAATISLISMAEQRAPEGGDKSPARLQQNGSPSQAGLQLTPVETPASPASSSGSALDPGLYRSLSMVSGTVTLAMAAGVGAARCSESGCVEPWLPGARRKLVFAGVRSALRA